MLIGAAHGMHLVGVVARVIAICIIQVVAFIMAGEDEFKLMLQYAMTFEALSRTYLFLEMEKRLHAN